VPRGKPQQKLTTIDDVLSAKVTFKVDNLDDLLKTVATIQDKVRQSYDVGFEFRIRVDVNGFREHGITKSPRLQPFAQRDKSVADVLTTVAVKMNPITIERSLTDPDQKVVWVVAKDKQSILITVRQSAKARSLELPSVFRATPKK